VRTSHPDGVASDILTPQRLQPVIPTIRPTSMPGAPETFTERVIDITPDLVHTLISDQFPELGGLSVESVTRQGWDNRTFRLGDQLAVRLPSAEGNVAGIEKEDRARPRD
jgi:hypothetical protein